MTTIHRRTILIDAARADPKTRTVEASLSSEEPVERGFGLEVLEHTTDAVDLTRAVGGLSLLFNHDPDALVGIVENVRLAGRRLRGRLRFGSSARAAELLADVEAGVVRHLSIGYRIDEIVPDGEDDAGRPIFRAIRWMLFEASIVAVPADATVGVGRSTGTGALAMPTQTTHNPNDSTGDEQGSRHQRRADNRAAIDERRRIQEIQEIARNHPECAELVDEAVSEGWPLDRFRREAIDLIGQRTNAGNPIRLGVPSGTIGMSRHEIESYSFIRAIRAQMDPAGAQRECGLEIEASRAVAQATGRRPQGLFIPWDVQAAPIDRNGRRALSVGTPTAGGHLVATDILAASFIDVLRNAMLTRELGATVLSGLVGDVAIPRKTAAASHYWVTEGNDITEASPAFDQVTLTPHTCGGRTEMSRRTVLQATPDIEALVRADLAATIASAIDTAAITGDTGSDEPRGILNTSGIGSVAGGSNGSAITWDDVVDLVAAISIDNALMGRLAFLTNSRVVASMRKTEKVSTTGFFIMDGSDLLGHRVGETNAVPSNLTKGGGSNLSALIFGNFADLLIGQWGNALDLIVDPYTLSASGGLRIVALADVDVAVRHPESFAAKKDIVTS